MPGRASSISNGLDAKENAPVLDAELERYLHGQNPLSRGDGRGRWRAGVFTAQ
jgi:hypothetical protein